MSTEFFSLAHTAYLLGVSEEALDQLLATQDVRTTEVDGIRMVSRKDLPQLYKAAHRGNDGEVSSTSETTSATSEPLSTNFDDDDDKSHPLSVSDDSSDSMPMKIENSEVWVVEDSELNAIHEERKRIHDRLVAQTEKMKRINVRVDRLRDMETGQSARFWERASAVYPELWSDGKYVAQEGPDHRLVIRRMISEQDEDFRVRFKQMVLEGIRRGHFPPGFMGVMPEDEDLDDDE